MSSFKNKKIVHAQGRGELHMHYVYIITTGDDRYHHIERPKELFPPRLPQEEPLDPNGFAFIGTFIHF